jgi:ADP-heptose:LPS heptosyltransferase
MLPRRNVLVLHAGALGDFVLSWPLIVALSRIHPQSRIMVVTHASKGALAEAALHVESSDIERGWHALFAEGGEAPEPVARMISAAHSIYSFISSAGDATTANLTRIAGPEARVLTLNPRPTEDYARHASEYLLEQLEPSSPARAGVQQILRSIASRGIGAARSDSGEILVHPGSGGEHKRWPLPRFIKLIERLKRKRTVRVVLGEVENDRLTPQEIGSLKAVAEIVTPHNYVQLFNELRLASMLIANDSGPGHLAGIIGLPTVSIFAPTNPAIWKPLGPRVKVVRGPSLDKISVDDVFHAAMAT